MYQKLARLLRDSCNASCGVIYFQDGKYTRNLLINKVLSGWCFCLFVLLILIMRYWHLSLYAIFILHNSIQINGKGHSWLNVLRKEHIRMCRTVNIREKNGGKVGLALDLLPFSWLQIRLGNGRLAESSLAANSCRNENGTLSGRKPQPAVLLWDHGKHKTWEKR